MKKIIILIIIVIFVAVGFVVFNKEAPVVKEEEIIVKDELPAQEGLPPQVATKRQAIYKAALSRDYEALAAETAPDFFYSFGGEYEGGFVAYLKLAEMNEGESAFDVIPTLLRLPYAYKNDLYTWPSVFTIEPSKWTEEDVAMMRTFLTDEEIEGFREFGGYIYYRLGITSEGAWTFYLAGD